MTGSVELQDKRSALLRILPEEAPLRTSGPFLAPLGWSGEAQSQQPRALRGLARIVDGGLCHRCGSCVGICPTKVLSTDSEGYPRIAALSSCTDCDLCVKVCPGDEFNYAQAHTQVFGTPGDVHATHGEFKEGILAYASDPAVREGSTSGGLVTALLLHLLESDQIDGAIVISSDDKVLWKGKPMLARSRAELLGAMKSKYAISPTNVVLSQIRETAGRYAVVGLPCQIHGLVKAAALDQRIKERVVLTIGLFCHAAIEHRAFEILWDTLGSDAQSARRFVSRIGKHPGTPHLELPDGSLKPVYFPQARGYRPTSIEMINILYRLFTPARCLTCFDASAEFADIAVGDPWMAPPEKDVDFYKGWSFALVRSARAQQLCAEAESAGKLVIKRLTQRESLACNTMMANEKRWRAFRVIETQRRQGKSIPAYGFESPPHTLKHFIKTELHMLSHLFCFLPRLRDGVLRFMLGRGGYWLLFLNHKRRWLRFWWRDSKEALRRKVLGRA